METVFVLAGPLGSGKSMAARYLTGRGMILGPKFTDRPRRLDDGDELQFVPAFVLRGTCDVVFESYSARYGFNTSSLRELSATRDVVVHCSDFAAIQELKARVSNLKTIMG
jgi:hypothetical protein